jgi:hypothetical protein
MKRVCIRESSLLWWDQCNGADFRAPCVTPSTFAAAELEDEAGD